jgi:hypothetical protein
MLGPDILYDVEVYKNIHDILEETIYQHDEGAKYFVLMITEELL